MSQDGDEGGAKKPLPLFEFGKGRPRAAPQSRPVAPPPEPPPPLPKAPPPPRANPVPSSGFQTPLYGTAKTPAAGFAPVTPSFGTPKTPAAGFAPVSPNFGTPKTPAASFAPVSPNFGTPKTPAAGFAPVSPSFVAPKTPAAGFVPVASGAKTPASSRGFENPLSADVVQWLQAMLRAIRGRRLYPSGHAILAGYLSRANEELQRVLSKMNSIELRVREDRLFFDKDEVHTDSDRLEGLPFLLFSHSIQQIEFRAGMTGEELTKLIEYLSADYRRAGVMDEDLVAALWRMNLPHFDYFVVDIYKLEISDRGVMDPSAMVADDETRRIRAELGQIVQALQADLPDSGRPIEAGARADQFASDAGAQLANPDVDEWDIDAMLEAEGLSGVVADAQDELREKDSHDVLLSRLVELLVRALRAEAGEVQGTPGWGLLLGLLDAVLRARQFAELQRVIERLATYLTHEPQLRDAGLKSLLMRHAGAQASVEVVLSVLDTTADPRETKAGLGLLEYLGAHAYVGLLNSVSLMNQPQARRLVVEVIAGLAKDDAGEMLVALRGARAEVVREVLALGEGFPALVSSGLVWLGSEDLETSVRAQAVGLLKGFSGHRADHMVARFMDDRESLVRMEAYRAAAHRSNLAILNGLLGVVKARELSDLEIGEVHALFGALAGTGSDKATTMLARVLTESNTLGISRYSVEVRVAAARALGVIGSSGAKKVLEGAMRTLNRRIKQACRTALETRSCGALHLDLPTRFGELDPRPFELDRPLPSPVAQSVEPVLQVPHSSPVVAPLAPAPAPVEPDAAEVEEGGLTWSPASAVPGALAAIPLAPAPVVAQAEPPPMLDPGALRSASGSRLGAEQAFGDSVLDAPTLADRLGAPTTPPAADLAALVDDLSLFAPVPAVAPLAPVPPPRLPSSALMAPMSDEEEGS